jgi:hypothetical protein
LDDNRPKQRRKLFPIEKEPETATIRWRNGNLNQFWSKKWDKFDLIIRIVHMLHLSSSGVLPTSPAQPLPRTCRTCKTKFTMNNERACVYHPESFSGETAQRWLPPGDFCHLILFFLNVDNYSFGLLLEFHRMQETESRAHRDSQIHLS